MTFAHLRLAGATPPLAAFRRLYANDRYAFLCESLGEAGRNRFSFFGGRPTLVHRSRPAEITLENLESGETTTDSRDLLESIRAVLSQVEAVPEVPPFSSGLVGYLGYDVVRRFERLPGSPPDPEGLPDSVLLLPSEIVVVDHLTGATDIIVHGRGGGSRVEEIRSVVEREQKAPPPRTTGEQTVTLDSRTPRPTFERGVHAILEHIRAGDIFQGVLSQRFETDFASDPLELYDVLRDTNAAPYMYYLKLGPGHAVLGSSPEILVSLEGRRALTRPLAGTRPRGASPEQDVALASELLQDEKELAEHVMLVDLARNDLGRVCEYGSVRVTRQFEIERHARVMHIVSEVEGELRPQHDALDLFRATFPAGTVTGAPKIRAMEIIDSLEPVRRGLYGGAIGYIDPASRMDLCLAIRTLVVHRGRVLLQAGAGVVSDSDPAHEYEETLHKASALVQALERCNSSPSESATPEPEPAQAESTSAEVPGSGGLSKERPSVSAAPEQELAQAEFTSAGARGSGGLSTELPSVSAAPQLKK